ncbi:unnamed protein product [Effrenium voratum]|nr:unnamed protein product [Effrenium voratum]
MEWRVGEVAECYSVSHQQWCRGQVVELRAGAVVLSYSTPIGQSQKTMALDQLRRPPVSRASALPEAFVQARSFPKEPAPPRVEQIPFLGERPLGEVQEETYATLQRLIAHGDLQGARRALARARLLSVENLKTEEAAVQALEQRGEFGLLCPGCALDLGQRQSSTLAPGVFLGSNKELAAWINDENHLPGRLMVRRWDCDLQAAVTLLYQAEEAVARALEQQRHRFARSDRLGYLTTCPSGLGSAFRAKLRASLPQLGQKEKFHDLVRALGVQAKRVVKSEGSWDLSAVPCGRITEESDDQVRTLVAAAHRLGQLEKSAEGLDLAAEVAKLC